MTIKTSVLKPGLLVSLNTRIRGGVDYQRTELEAQHTTDQGAQRARWETVRTVPDPEEFEAATATRSKARATVAAVCVQSSFGLLCPSAKESELAAAMEEARKTTAEFNATAKRCRVEIYVLVGRVANDDVEAARAIGSEVRELLDQMRDGIAKADPDAIREAANKARNLGSMLTPETSAKVSAAVDEARKAAREIVKRVAKGAEAAADVVKELSVAKVQAARFAFLDLDEGEAQHQAPDVRPVELPELAPVASEPAAQPAAMTAATGEARSLELF